MNLSRVVFDYYTFSYFKNFSLRFVADIHYLMKAANQLDKPKTSFYQKNLDPVQENAFLHLQLQKQKAERELLQRAHLVICNSQYTRDLVVEHYQEEVKNKEVCVVPVALCLNSWMSSLSDGLRKKEILYHGRFNSVKRVDLLIEASHKISLPIHIFGIQEHLIEILERENYQNVTFHPWVSIDDKLLSQFEFHLFPSDYEPWGLALTKSRLSGAVCIASVYGGGHREQIRHEVDGYLLDFHADNYVAKLNELFCKDQQILNDVSSAARRSAELCLSGNYLGRYLDELTDFVK